MHRSPAQDFFSFLLGGGLFAGGIFLLLNQVMVATPGGIGAMGRGGGAYRHGMRYGYGAGLGLPPIGGLTGGMGLLMIPFGLGVALLFVNAYRKLAWLLVWGSGAALIVGILHSLDMNFMPTTLWALVTMIVMIAAGAGLMFKSLYGDGDRDKED
ncbi:hypothetical protein [Synechococcus sp. CS-1328]|uniref:hypothetical protein n=1 Tax=Synechococcus sp. CS-1328 TaxID=2847976 RepID=UPI00223AD84E|nr:hypothetical protein [Synechococcus sp. CS-1328]MCT0224296.1 hypothetical protein [Synechococcus sp. CS-1328]